MRVHSLAAAVFLGVSAVVLSAQMKDPITANDPLIGTWDLNVAKSTWKVTPPEKSETRTYRLVGQEIKATSTAVMMDGKTVTSSWTVVYDGKERPETALSGDSISLTRTDPYHSTAVEKKNGKVFLTTSRVIASDGKSLTLTSKGTNAKGEALTEVVVFDKK